MAGQSHKQELEKSIETLKSHVKLTCSDFPSSSSSSLIKVLENVGDHAYVIKFVIFNDYDLNLTIQIPNDYSLANSTVIVSHLTPKAKHDEQKLNDLREFVDSQIKLSDQKKDNESSLVRVFNKCLDYVDDKFERVKGVADSTSSPKRNNKKKSNEKSNKNGDDSENSSSNKKCPMKTAGDVVHRIQWDEAINKEFVTVGYLDRFLGLKECAFNTFDWGDIVLADLGSLAIPEHRISYFKYKNELVWDKASRLDNVFGSTGSGVTIHDVISRLEDKPFVRDDDQTEVVNRIGRVSEQTIRMADEQPNFFISIPVDDAEVKAKFASLVQQLVEANSSVENFLVPESSLHLTLCTLRINNDVSGASRDEIEKVKQILDGVASDKTFVEQNFPIKMKFEGVGEFYNKVMFVKCETDDQEKLNRVRKTILERLKEAGISTAGNYYDFRPHLTVFKISGDGGAVRNGTVTQLVPQELWEKYKTFYFGDIKVEQFELCKMVNIFRCLTYPVEFTTKFSL